MKPAARLSAAIEILELWLRGERPIDLILSDWGRAHRFAGSGDRAAIGDRVYTVLRRRARLCAMMGDESGRGLVLASLVDEDGITVGEIDERLAHGGPHAPAPLSSTERAALGTPLSEMSPWIAGSYPEWLHPSLERAFGQELQREAQSWLSRAPLDLRVNTLKAIRDQALRRLSEEGLSPRPTPLSPWGLRLEAGRSIAASPSYLAGWVEIQDEGSQLAALYADAKPGMTVCELGAGAGGKSLALAAQMNDLGTIHAADIDEKRLADIAPRARRAGVSIIAPRLLADERALDDLAGICDLVLIDAPCSGSGTWRRDPENKWRLTPQILSRRMAVQAGLLRRGAGLVKEGGHLVYVTCSVLQQENDGQIRSFLDADSRFSVAPPASGIFPECSDGMLNLSPGRSRTDGFFAARLVKRRVDARP